MSAPREDESEKPLRDIRKEWMEREDWNLAGRLQKGEFDVHYHENRLRNRSEQDNLCVARSLQVQELAASKEIQMNRQKQLTAPQTLVNSDKEAARALQASLVRPEAVVSTSQPKIEALTQRLQALRPLRREATGKKSGRTFLQPVDETAILKLEPARKIKSSCQRTKNGTPTAQDLPEREAIPPSSQLRDEFMALALRAHSEKECETTCSQAEDAALARKLQEDEIVSRRIQSDEVTARRLQAQLEEEARISRLLHEDEATARKLQAQLQEEARFSMMIRELNDEELARQLQNECSHLV